jgi:serine/threonine protein kinase HipA of HipAB toxin-antitoxin module
MAGAADSARPAEPLPATARWTTLAREATVAAADAVERVPAHSSQEPDKPTPSRPTPRTGRNH